MNHTNTEYDSVDKVYFHDNTQLLKQTKLHNTSHNIVYNVTKTIIMLHLMISDQLLQLYTTLQYNGKQVSLTISNC